MIYRINQIWKNKKKCPTSIFIIERIYTRVYSDHTESIRVVGTLIAEHDFRDNERDLDHRSLAKMFPYLMFETKKDYAFENK